MDADLAHAYTRVAELDDGGLHDANLIHMRVSDLADDAESEERAEAEDAEDAEDDEDEEHDEDDVDDMPHDLKRVKGYLLTLQRPVGMTDRVFNSFRQYALRFLMYEGVLFRRAKQNMPPKSVI